MTNQIVTSRLFAHITAVSTDASHHLRPFVGICHKVDSIHFHVLGHEGHVVHYLHSMHVCVESSHVWHGDHGVLVVVRRVSLNNSIYSLHLIIHWHVMVSR